MKQYNLDNIIGEIYRKKGIKFENMFEEILLKTHFSYVRESHAPWDFIIFLLEPIFIEIKHGKYPSYSKNQRKFMKEHFKNYIVIVYNDEYYTVLNYSPTEEHLILELTTHDPKSLFYYILTRHLALKGTTYGIKEYLKGYQKSPDIFLSFLEFNKPEKLDITIHKSSVTEKLLWAIDNKDSIISN